MNDYISRQAAIDAASSLCDDCDSGYCGSCRVNYPGEGDVIKALKDLPPAQPETCEGCKHLGKWENEVEYGYPSPCTRCKRRVEDRYER